MLSQQRNKIIIISSVVIIILMIVCLATCGGGCRRSNGNPGRSTKNVTIQRKNSNGSDNPRAKRRRGRRDKGSNGSDETTAPYLPQTITVPSGGSLGEVVRNNDPSFRGEDQTKGLGGSKLIAEMSADVSGLYTSRNFSSEAVRIRICSIEELHLHICNRRQSVYSRIRDGQIIMGSSSVSFHGDELNQIIDFVQSLLTQKIQVFFSFTNVTDDRIDCEIQQGQMLEIVNEDVQNLVVAENVYFSVGARETVEIQAHVYCASRHRGDPSLSSVRFTKYILDASSVVYNSQESVWNYIETSYR